MSTKSKSKSNKKPVAKKPVAKSKKPETLFAKQDFTGRTYLQVYKALEAAVAQLGISKKNSHPGLIIHMNHALCAEKVPAGANIYPSHGSHKLRIAPANRNLLSIYNVTDAEFAKLAHQLGLNPVD